jgi:anthranilate phosphoribosyltransferase
VLRGDPGPRRDIVLLNASAAFVAGGRVGDMREGVVLAGDSIDSGQARKKLDQLIEFTNEFN